MGEDVGINVAVLSRDVQSSCRQRTGNSNIFLWTPNFNRGRSSHTSSLCNALHALNKPVVYSEGIRYSSPLSEEQFIKYLLGNTIDHERIFRKSRLCSNGYLVRINRICTLITVTREYICHIFSKLKK